MTDKPYIDLRCGDCLELMKDITVRRIAEAQAKP